MPSNRFEVDGVKLVIEKPVGAGGKISGFTDWIGRKAIIIILEDDDE